MLDGCRVPPFALVSELRRHLYEGAPARDLLESMRIMSSESIWSADELIKVRDTQSNE